MGWVFLAAIGGSVFVLLRLTGVSRAFGWLAASALMLGATGYALQQRATLPGHPVRAESQPIEIDPGMVAFRTMILAPTPGSARDLAAADAQVRSGATFEALRGLLHAIRQSPREAALWVGLGSALAAHDGGQVSPAAQFAFWQAWRLAPRAPGPPFFLGLAYIQTGEFAAAKIAWLRALALTPRDAPYRVDIAERLVAIDQFEAMSKGSAPAE